MNEVVDLTNDLNDGSDDHAAAAAVTPDRPYNRRGRPPSRKSSATSASTTATQSSWNSRPTKRVRMSSRLMALAEKNESTDKDNGDDDDDAKEDDDTPEYDASNNNSNVAEGAKKKSTNGYYEVDEILDRRTRRYGADSGGRHVVEYLVSWKKTSEDEEYEPSWLIAENLDQNSIASAFRMFPMDADPDRNVQEKPKAKKKEKEPPSEELFDLDDDFTDDDEEDGPGDFMGSDSKKSSSEEDIPEYDPNDDNDDDDDDNNRLANDKTKDPTLQNEISHLGNSDYDTPGTVELVIHRKCYRVGQSFFSSETKNFLYTISMIQPKTRQAKCLKFMRMEETFVCPSGREGEYIQLKEEVVLDLTLLRIPCKEVVKRVPFLYEQDESGRAFCYSNEIGKVLYHPMGKPAALDLFAGAGGMSIGLEKAGFDVKWMVDNDHLAAATYRANTSHNNVQIYTEDAKTFLKKSIQGNPCYPKVGDVDHIHASPPCKGFSRANRNGGKDDMLNNKQTLLFVKAIMHFRPKTATFENVPGLILDDFKRYLQSVASNLLAMSYQVRVEVLGSHLYGDPQRRRRLILWASRKDCLMPSSPSPTHGIDLLPVKTTKDALQMLEKYDPASSRSSGSVLLKETVIFNHIIPRFKPDKSDDYVLLEEEPSRTILARARPHVHYSCDRFISVREAACLQSFPPSYQFFGSLASQYSQVGNAVPVCLATAVAKSVAVVHGCPT